MTLWRVILANLRHCWRPHFGTCMGTSLSAMILVGALAIGDSISETLLHKAEERVGQITHVFLSEEGHFHSDLAERMQRSMPKDHQSIFAPMVLTRGTLASPDGNTRANDVVVLGINEKFFRFAEHRASGREIPESGFWTSPDLTEEIDLKAGERMVLRVEEPSLFSREAPLSGERDARFVSWNLSSLGALTQENLGNFSLRADMEPIRTVFVPLSLLQRDMFARFDPQAKRTDFANLIIVKTDDSIEQLLGAINDAWSIEDAGLELKKLREPEAWSLRARQVFLSDATVRIASGEGLSYQGEFTYLVNAIRLAGKTGLIPYSMVTGVEPAKSGPLPIGWQKSDIALNKWAAEDLNLSLGDSVELEYFTVGDSREIIERTRAFKVGKILPMPPKIPHGEESEWTPRFPGLSDAQNCGEWDTGIPIKYKIRPKDESYWDNFRGSPKAFISLTAAQEIWGNRWGNHTGLRFFGDEQADRWLEALNRGLSPEVAGIRLIPIRKEAEASVSGPVDFNQLFLAFGLFVILAGLSLSAALFGFSLEQRNSQFGLFLALGYSVRRILIMIWVEAGLVCLIGSIFGIGWAWFFGKGILWMLSTSWSGAVAGLEIHFAPSRTSIFLGALGSFLMGLTAMAWSCRKLMKQTPINLLKAGEFIQFSMDRELNRTHSLYWKNLQIASLLGAIFLFVATLQFELYPAASFFGIGAFLLIAGILGYVQSYKKPNARDGLGESDFLFNLDRRSGRKAVTVGVLAVGTFLVLGAGAFRKNVPKDLMDLASGTGGFTHILKTSLPVYDDLLGEQARELFNLSPNMLEGVEVVPVRYHAGDDASCLNLNQSNSPPLHGVPVGEMVKRFAFVEGGWASLTKETEDGVIPALIDQNTMTWSLKKKVGDRIIYKDAEGKEFEVEIAAVVKGTILQGGLYVSNNHWLEKFPGRGGFNHFWLGGPEDKVNQAIKHLTHRLSNYGVRSLPAKDRLNRLYAVENTYLSIFQALGGMGVLLGTIGLIVLIVRNLWERRRIHAILFALGYSLHFQVRMAERENLRIVAGGLLIGASAGLIGSLPIVLLQAHEFSAGWAIGFALLLFALAAVSVKIGVFCGFRKSRLGILNNE